MPRQYAAAYAALNATARICFLVVLWFGTGQKVSPLAMLLICIIAWALQFVFTFRRQRRTLEAEK